MWDREPTRPGASAVLSTDQLDVGRGPDRRPRRGPVRHRQRRRSRRGRRAHQRPPDQRPGTFVTLRDERMFATDRIAPAANGLDLAAVVTNGPEVTPIALAPSDPEAGDEVTMVGYPWGERTIIDARIEGTLARGDVTVLRFSPEPHPGPVGEPADRLERATGRHRLRRGHRRRPGPRHPGVRRPRRARNVARSRHPGRMR